MGDGLKMKYFVLKPSTDPAARAALQAYALATPNNQLAAELMVWVRDCAAQRNGNKKPAMQAGLGGPGK